MTALPANYNWSCQPVQSLNASVSTSGTVTSVNFLNALDLKRRDPTDVTIVSLPVVALD